MKSILIALGAVIAHFILSFLLTLGGNWILSNLPGQMNRNFWVVLLNCIIELIFLLIFAAWYLGQKAKQKKKPNYKKVFSVKNICTIIGIAIFGQVVCGFIVAVMSLFFTEAASEYSQVVSSFSLENTSPLLMILLVGIIGPMAEEFFFRGVLYENLKQGIERWAAMLASALVFGIFHGNLIQGVYAVLAGMLLAYIYEKAGTIWASILVHILFNLSFYIIKYISIFMEWLGFPLTGIRYLGFIMLSFIMVIICLRQFARSMREERKSEYERISEIR